MWSTERRREDRGIIAEGAPSRCSCKEVLRRDKAPAITIEPRGNSCLRVTRTRTHAEHARCSHTMADLEPILTRGVRKGAQRTLFSLASYAKIRSRALSTCALVCARRTRGEKTKEGRKERKKERKGKKKEGNRARRSSNARERPACVLARKRARPRQPSLETGARHKQQRQQRRAATTRSQREREKERERERERRRRIRRGKKSARLN